MRAAVYRGREDVAITDVEEPACGPGRVKVEVAYNGICGTDLHEYYAGPIFIPTEPHAITGATLPVTLGHEFSGTVVEVGDGVERIDVGDRVTIEPVYRCDECPPCRSGRYNVCQRIGFHGLMADGGMAQVTVVEERMVHALPDSVSLEMGALVEPMSVAYHAAKLGEVGAGDSAMVFGAGPIGIGIWFALRGLGVSDITVVEPSEVRRKAIEALGATDVIDPTATDPAEHIMASTGGRGADAVYDAAGVQPAVEAALQCLGAHRSLIAVAIYEEAFPVSLINLVLGESRIRGSLCYTGEDYQAVIDLMAQGHYDATGWVEVISLDEVVEGFERLHGGQAMKLLVKPAS
jgi:(R,R)-butanediol dehydrogenase / meso-butanediol dehydrogenase / diacetyl reductase